MGGVLLLLALVTTVAVQAATTVTVVPAEVYTVRKQRAFGLITPDPVAAEKQLSQLLVESKDDPEVLFQLGRLVMNRGQMLKEGSKRKQTLKEGREYYVRAQQAGSTEPLIRTALAEVNADGSENRATFSNDAKVNEAIHAAESAFGKRDFDKAITLYQQALALDPHHYQATLYLGDAYFANGEYARALTWFGKATELEPNKETAYRYSGDAFVRLGRKDDALEQYLQAFIADPYNGYTWRALQAGWQTLGLNPRVPAQGLATAQVKPDKDGKPEISLAENFTMLDIAYAGARSKWQSEHPLTPTPNGPAPAYRQTLAEETAALQTMLAIWQEQIAATGPEAEKSARQIAALTPALTQLKAINDAGLLEPCILYFRANQDLAADYVPYRDANRAKLHEFLVRFFLRAK
ncbi:MAG: tetratricopeptide repeat protein [Lacunisphaera sp.]